MSLPVTVRLVFRASDNFLKKKKKMLRKKNKKKPACYFDSEKM